jgi:hypothetical protein
MDLGIKSRRFVFGIPYSTDPNITIPYDIDQIISLLKEIKNKLTNIKIFCFNESFSQNIFEMPDKLKECELTEAKRIIVKSKEKVILQIIYIGYGYGITNHVGRIIIHDNELSEYEILTIRKIFFKKGYKASFIQSSVKQRIFIFARMGTVFFFLFLISLLAHTNKWLESDNVVIILSMLTIIFYIIFIAYFLSEKIILTKKSRCE